MAPQGRGRKKRGVTFFICIFLKFVPDLFITNGMDRSNLAVNMRRPVKKRHKPEPDSKYTSPVVAVLINKIMQSGKKLIAQKIVYGAMEEAEKKLNKPAIDVLNTAIDNAGPQVELRSRRIGGANYQVPFEVKAERRLILAMRWIINAARSQKGKPMKEKLAVEIINAFNNTGVAIKKKVDTHKMAEANKAFAHFAW